MNQFHCLTHFTTCLIISSSLHANPPANKVERDPNVKPTIASTKDQVHVPKVIINAFHKDKKLIYTNEEGKDITDTLEAHIKQQVVAFATLNIVPMLHLRCHRALAWKDIQKVQQTAARHGITKVNFSSFKSPPTDTK